MIFRFSFKYQFLNVAEVFWQIMGKGAYVAFQREIQKYSSVTRNSVMMCILTREGSFQYQAM